jgi:hypothetical protein
MERAINFNAAMVNAILQGRKTQTRRIAPIQFDNSKFWGDYDCYTFYKKMKPFIGFSIENGGLELVKNHCPYGNPGDRLWVRESFQYLYDFDLHSVKEIETETLDILYVADRPDSLWDAKIRPPQHMPRWASRITLEIESVRVERLQDISEADCWKEGIEILDGYFDSETIKMSKKLKLPMEDARPFFACIWESIYGAESWHSNPWVWVIEFKKLADKADGE